MAGTASSVLGFVRFGLGALTAPLVGLAGANAVLPLGIITLCCVTIAWFATVFLIGHEQS